jgi:aminobenzoyl-glutamate utilization protein A
VEAILKKIKGLEEDIINWRRSFHQYPEVGWTEIRTASLVARELEKLGFDLMIGKEVVDGESRMGLPDQSSLDAAYNRAISQGADPDYAPLLRDGFTGVVGLLKCGEGPTIGMRFDMDALPVKESTKPSHKPFVEGFASNNSGLMHACGHDGHTAIGLGVASVLAGLKEEFKGTIKLIFQPAEEGVRGAKAMVESGVVDDVDILLGMHLGMKENSSNHVYAQVSGFFATTKYDIHFRGVPSHAGNQPENGKNALLASATTALQLQAIPRHSAGLTRINVGRLEAGSGRNIIADEAYMMVETRGGNSEVNDYMGDHVTRIVESVANLYQVSYEIEAVGHAEGGANDLVLSNLVEDLVPRISPDLRVMAPIDSFGGSEDFTAMMDRVQGHNGKACYILVGSNITAPHHNGDFDFDEGDMINGVRLMCLAARAAGCL